MYKIPEIGYLRLELMKVRVARGMQLLNRYFDGRVCTTSDDGSSGGHWINRVYLGKLNILAYHGCLLGQVFGGYDKGVRVLKAFLSLPKPIDNYAKDGDTVDFAIDHGFVPSTYRTEFTTNRRITPIYKTEAHMLGAMWIGQISKQSMRLFDEKERRRTCSLV